MRRQWEYHRLVMDGAAFLRGEADEPLRCLGLEGWELTIAVPRDKHGYQHEVCLVFKRPSAEATTTTTTTRS